MFLYDIFAQYEFGVLTQGKLTDLPSLDIYNVKIYIATRISKV
jgi:hypothetical protein